MFLTHIDTVEKQLKQVVDDTFRSLKDIKNQFRLFVKQSSRKLNQSIKDARVAKRRRTQPQQSGITRPRRITAVLSQFLDVPADSLLSLTDVSGRVCKYIKTLNLQNPADRRQIFCDDKLKALLKPENDTISYPILQRLLTQHLIKEDIVAAPAAPAASSS